MLCLSLATICPTLAAQPLQKSPNVVFVITDDQGYGDLGFTGNPIIKTPHLDKLAAESVWLEDFHVAPSCSPTRASMLTGRWTNRTGVWHTFFARAMMYEDEVTIADHFQAAGYSTGMFGKWHLGDHYPYRPQDRGFDLAYCIRGGATGVTADYWDNDYFDDHHFRNDKPTPSTGYSTDVFFAESQRFIKEQVARKKPFFAWIATTAPHKPWVCPPKYSQLYPKENRQAAAFYGMVTNIDENVGRLRASLEELGVADNTLFIFTTDNGSVGPKKFNAGMRGGKISPYEGGHRVPFALHWPDGGYSNHVRVKELTHMVDVLPTLLDLCDVKPHKQVALDGRSIRKLLSGKGDTSFDWESRVVVSDSQRIQVPRKWKDSSVMSGKWRLVKGTELYDIRQDPGQQNNIAKAHPQQFARLHTWYENWWAELEPTFSRTSKVYVGTPQTPELQITALQWIDAYPPWNQGIIRRASQRRARGQSSEQPIQFPGHWAVHVAHTGHYTFEVRRWPEESGLKIREGVEALPVTRGCLPSYSAVRGTALPVFSATLRINGKDLETKPVGEDDGSIRFTHRLTKGDHKFSPYFSLKPTGKARTGNELGCYYLTVRLLQ
ncbi:MAG: arylsulfatase [Verrucomicrobia subdivision 3 bacterium]|nr:arylsulfatase [Limisphaerales bacterium]